MLAHSQGGAFGFKVAEQRPDKIKAIVAVESATAGIVANAPKLKDVPVLMVFGDYRRSASALGGVQEDRHRIRQRHHGGGRDGRLDQPSRDRHQGQLAHADAGQEQRRDRRRDPEMAGAAKGCRLKRGLTPFSRATSDNRAFVALQR